MPLQIVVYIAPGTGNKANLFYARVEEGWRREYPNWRPSASYARYPETWIHIGHMNAQGKLVAFDSDKLPGPVFTDLMSNEPLMAGTAFWYHEDGSVVE